MKGDAAADDDADDGEDEDHDDDADADDDGFLDLRITGQLRQPCTLKPP